MIVEQIWTANGGRNFNYLIACAETGEALAVDPLDYQKCLAAAKAKGWTITQILNTHDHRDHTGGNDEMVARHRRQGAGAQERQGADPRDRSWSQCRRRDQGGPHRRAAMPRHARPHDVAYLHPRAWRHAGAVLRRHALQRRRRQLPQWRPPERALRHLRQPAVETAGDDAGLSRPRLHREQSEVHARPRARQRQGGRRCCRGWRSRTPTSRW